MCRLAHRLREMHTLPYVVLTNPHLALVYGLYRKAFETLSKVPIIESLEENDQYCRIIKENLGEHLAVIPNLLIGVIECQDIVKPEIMESFINAMLRAVCRCR